MLRILLGAFAVLCATACVTQPKSDDRIKSTITLPLQEAWYENKKVYYISTDISDPRMALGAGINLAPRLTDAIPEYPKPPEMKTVLERVYKFPNNEQDAVFASAPDPVGPNSRDRQYSPLWLIYSVTWPAGRDPHELKSEQAILDAEAAHSVEVIRSSIVVNCPIVGTASGDSLAGSRITRGTRN